MGWAITATCLYLCHAIWVRRWTLSGVSDAVAFRERSITHALLLQLCALFLMSPLSSWTLDRIIHAVTGCWNIDAFLGHACYLGVAAAIVLHVATRLEMDDEELMRRFKQRCELPMVLIIPISFAMFTQSPNAAQDWDDIFDAPTDVWLDLYFTLIGGYVSYLLVRLIYMLSILRDEPRNRRTATIYMLASATGVVACLLRIYATWADQGDANWYWALMSAAAIMFAFASSQSWRARVRWFQELSRHQS